MITVLKYLKIGIVFLLIGLGTWAVIANYSVVFSHTVIGEVVDVVRIELPVTLVTKSEADFNSKVFSFAVGIKDQKTGEIHTASSEDRQWAVVHKGNCVEAVYLPYPPWDFRKKGTYFGARLIRLLDKCP